MVCSRMAQVTITGSKLEVSKRKTKNQSTMSQVNFDSKNATAEYKKIKNGKMQIQNHVKIQKFYRNLASDETKPFMDWTKIVEF